MTQLFSVPYFFLHSLHLISSDLIIPIYSAKFYTLCLSQLNHGFDSCQRWG